MKASEITVGSKYTAKVSGKLTTVRVDRIESTTRFGKAATAYHVTNLTTGRRTTFRSASKFRACASKISGNSVRAWKFAMTHLLAVTACTVGSLERWLAEQMPGCDGAADANRIAAEWIKAAAARGAIKYYRSFEGFPSVELLDFTLAGRMAL